MHLFSVATVPPDLRHEETIHQAVASLAHLQHTIAAVFDRIDERIARNERRVDAINTRLNAANRLGQQLLGQRGRAICILSPAEYPAPAECRDIEQTFARYDGGDSSAAPVSVDVLLAQQSNDEIMGIRPTAEYAVQTPFDPHVAQHRSPRDKLQFYHVHTAAGPPAEVGCNEGFGDRVPAFVQSVDALLLHGHGSTAAANVYTEFKRAAAAQRRQLGGAKLRTVPSQRSPVSTSSSSSYYEDALGAAPPSISNRQRTLHSTLSAADALFYAPSSAAVQPPELVVPLDLPDLPDIAENVDLMTQAAGAAWTTSLTTGNRPLPDLPDLPDLSDISSSAVDAGRSVGDKLNPPPPPPSPSMQTFDVPDVATSAGPVAPPPPPPPPPPEMLSEHPPPAPTTAPRAETEHRAPAAAREPVANRHSAAASSSSSDDRSSLMAAIREAAGGQKMLRAASMVETRSASEARKV